MVTNIWKRPVKLRKNMLLEIAARMLKTIDTYEELESSLQTGVNTLHHEDSEDRRTKLSNINNCPRNMRGKGRTTGAKKYTSKIELTKISINFQKWWKNSKTCGKATLDEPVLLKGQDKAIRALCPYWVGPKAPEFECQKMINVWNECNWTRRSGMGHPYCVGTEERWIK